MKISIVAVALISLSACKNRQKATEADCKPGCDRVAGFRIAQKVASMRSMVHEADENVERVEEQTEKTIAQLKKELGSPGTPFEPRNFRHLPPKTQKELAARHQWEEDQLKQQREMALKNAEAALVEARQHYETLKARAATDEKALKDEASKACVSTCVQRTTNFAQCLQKTQAVEDADICEKM